MNGYNSIQYLLDDHPGTLFPLTTTFFLSKHFGNELLKYVYEKVLDDSCDEYSFLPQLQCHASKYGLHLRRTVSLDPVAKIFIYDLVYLLGYFAKGSSMNKLIYDCVSQFENRGQQ